MSTMYLCSPLTSKRCRKHKHSRWEAASVFLKEPASGGGKGRFPTNHPDLGYEDQRPWGINHKPPTCCHGNAQDISEVSLK